MFDKCFETLGKAFVNYPLFDYFLGGKESPEAIGEFWNVAVSSGRGQYRIVTDSDQVQSVAVLAPPGLSDPSLPDTLKAGGLRLFTSFGWRGIWRVLSFESFAGKIKKEIVPENCWYLFSFGTLPESRGQGVGSKTLRKALEIIDEKGEPCYLETLKEVNTKIYAHFGFELVRTTPIPGTSLVIYSMLRK